MRQSDMKRRMKSSLGTLIIVISLPEFIEVRDRVSMAGGRMIRVSIRIVKLRSSSLFRHHQSPKRHF